MEMKMMRLAQSPDVNTETTLLREWQRPDRIYAGLKCLDFPSQDIPSLGIGKRSRQHLFPRGLRATARRFNGNANC
jgi:hypothetical protein